MTVHEHVPVINHLACRLAGVAETCAEADIIETAFEKLEKDDTGDTTAARSLLVVSAELLLKDAVLETELLLLAECDGIF